MKNFWEKLFANIPNSARYIVALSALLSLLPLLPSNATFKYKFNQGQTWLYDDLLANFAFAILKSPEEIARERVELDRELSPYYELDLETIAERKKIFQQRFDAQLKQSRAQFPDVAKNTEGYVAYSNYVLTRLLSRGILKIDTFIERRDKEFVINILRGNVTEKQTLDNILTPKKVGQWLSDSLPFVKSLEEPEFLLPLLEPLLSPNLAFNAEKTREFKQQELDKMSTSRGMVKSGELIVPKGGIVTQSVYQKLISFKEHYESDYLASRKFYLVLFGYALIVGMMLALFLFYLQNHAKTAYQKLRWIVFLLGWVVMYTYLMYGVRASDVLHPYIVPFCIAPIIIKTFYNRELAFVTHTISVLIAGLITSPGYEFILLQMMVGLVVVFSRFDTRYWGNFYQSIVSIIVVYMLGYIGISFIEEPNFALIKWSVLIWLALNGFLTLLAYPLIPLFGNLLGFISSITLAELSDLGHPLLKELSMKAPGTLQHSLQVANLSEAAAAAIGANDLLVKVGALYHDLGKTSKPQYFIENQSGTNTHDLLSPLESATVIIEHITEGVKMAEKLSLPQPIIRFIQTHHGTTAVEFFYRLHLDNLKKNGSKNASDTEGSDFNGLERAKFVYNGPKPKTREETILLLADSLESAAKSMKNPTSESIDNLVTSIINHKISQGQLDESALTFNELELCKASFRKMLKSIHHVRIEYPSVKNT
ncbi:MAG: HDIG domain-containing protein [Saprospiraceae bacterium]|nr:HDIG domain-containing protein [Saprospiraceae bacterium]